MLEHILARYPEQFRGVSLPPAVVHEAKNRVMDALGCYYGAYDVKPVRILRETLSPTDSGPATLWGTARRLSPENAAWLNGAGVRALDYNDTYLSKEPCHPSDLLAALWAACEISGRTDQGAALIRGLTLAYEVVCRLCDAASIRLRGWDHVTYLPIASAVGCASIFRLDPERTRNAIALAMTPQTALRQTRVGEISDWKAACASYGARAGLWAARLAQNGFTGPSDIFSGRHGFFRQVSGAFRLPAGLSASRLKFLSTHVKYYPAEHHSQSAIEAALQVRDQIRSAGAPVQAANLSAAIRRVTVTCFDVAVQIIGSEKEKWTPNTRETADHSMPYLVAAALLDGDVHLGQYIRRRFLDSDIRATLKKTRVTSSPVYSRQYPRLLPTRVEVVLAGERHFIAEVPLPKGYAGRPLTDDEMESKFRRLAEPKLGPAGCDRLIRRLRSLEKVGQLKTLAPLMSLRGTK